MAAIIADKFRGSGESADKEAEKVVKRPKVTHKKSSKTQSQPTLLLTRNSFDPLTVKEAPDDGNYSDQIPLLESDTDSDAEDITNNEVRVILSSNFKINRYILIQLANSLPIKTIAERGAAAHQPCKKITKQTKWKAPVQHVLSASALSMSKKAHVEDIYEEEDVQELKLSITSQGHQADHTKARVCVILIFIQTVYH